MVILWYFMHTSHMLAHNVSCHGCSLQQSISSLDAGAFRGSEYLCQMSDRLSDSRLLANIRCTMSRLLSAVAPITRHTKRAIACLPAGAGPCATSIALRTALGNPHPTARSRRSISFCNVPLALHRRSRSSVLPLT